MSSPNGTAISYEQIDLFRAVEALEQAAVLAPTPDVPRQDAAHSRLFEVHAAALRVIYETGDRCHGSFGVSRRDEDFFAARHLASRAHLPSVAPEYLRTHKDFFDQLLAAAADDQREYVATRAEQANQFLEANKNSVLLVRRNKVYKPLTRVDVVGIDNPPARLTTLSYDERIYTIHPEDAFICDIQKLASKAVQAVLRKAPK